MAVAQVSLVSAVKAAPVRASAVSRRSARAVNVVAKAGVERFEVAKKAAPVALAVGASPPIPSKKIRTDARFVLSRAARRVTTRSVRSRASRSALRPGRPIDPPADPGARARFTNDRGSIHRPSTSRDRARSRENRAARSRAALTAPYLPRSPHPGTVMTATEARAAEVVAAVPRAGARHRGHHPRAVLRFPRLLPHLRYRRLRRALQDQAHLSAFSVAAEGSAACLRAFAHSRTVMRRGDSTRELDGARGAAERSRA